MSQTGYLLRAVCEPAHTARTPPSQSPAFRRRSPQLPCGDGSLTMACPGCSSGNVEKLSHYWESLPAESPLRGRYAPPARLEPRYLLVLAAVGAGLWIAFRDSVLWGLAIVVAGLVWGVIMMVAVGVAEAQYGNWASSKLCLTCTKRYQ